VWLCRPNTRDACAASQDATIVAVNGTLTRETFHPAKNPPIDCFYVYPTVSNEPAGNSDLIITGAERSVVNTQFARFCIQVPSIRTDVPAGSRLRRCGAMIAEKKPMPMDRDLAL